MTIPKGRIHDNKLWGDNGLYDALVGLLDYGLDYIIDTNDQTITIYNNNCLPLNITQNFEINVGINFDILCNPWVVDKYYITFI